MDPTALLELFAAQSVPQLIVALTIWPVITNLMASGLESSSSKWWEAIQLRLKKDQSALHEAWLDAFKTATETAYKRWHTDWRGKSRSLRRAGRKDEADNILRRAKSARTFLKRRAGVIFADWRIDLQLLSGIVSNATLSRVSIT